MNLECTRHNQDISNEPKTIQPDLESPQSNKLLLNLLNASVNLWEYLSEGFLVVQPSMICENMSMCRFLHWSILLGPNKFSVIVLKKVLRRRGRMRKNKPTIDALNICEDALPVRILHPNHVLNLKKWHDVGTLPEKQAPSLFSHFLY